MGLLAAQRRIVLGLLVCLMLLSAALLYPGAEGSEPGTWSYDWGMFCIGGYAAWTCLLAAWAALAGSPLLVRLPATLGLVGLLTYALLWTIHYGHPDRSDGEIQLVPLLFLCLAVALWLVRCLSHWRLELLRPQPGGVGAGGRQFTLRQMLAWTAGVAVFLALDKCVPCDWSWRGDQLQSLTVVGAVISGVMLPLLVASLGLFLGCAWRKTFLLATVAALLAVTAVVLVLGFPVRPLLSSNTVLWFLRPAGLRFALLAWFKAAREPLVSLGGFLLVFWGTLGVVRVCGYRMVRRPLSVAVSGEVRSVWRTPFPYLLLLLSLVFVGLCWPALLFERSRQMAALWRESQAQLAIEHGQVTGITFGFTGKQLVLSEAVLQEMVKLADSPQFRELRFCNATISKRELVILPKLKHLRTLSFWGTGISDADLAALGNLTTLETLGLLMEPQVTGGVFQHLRTLRNLRSLTLRATGISGRGLAELKGLDRLEILDVSDTPLGDESLKWLAGRSRLKVLVLERTHVTDAGLAPLQGLKALETLSLKQTTITDRGLPTLAGMPHLRWLDLSGTKATTEGTQQLQQTLPDCKILPP